MKMKKIVLVTGGNSGIGYATAQLFQEKGYDVCISGRNEERLTEAGEALNVRWLLADMSKQKDIATLADPFIKNGLDALVLNAGIPGAISFNDFTREDYDLIFNTNLFGNLLLMRELIPTIMERKGSITVVSSLSSTIGAPLTVLYGASKGALEGAVCGLVAAYPGLRINIIAPGPTETPIYEKGGMTQEQIKAITLAIPLGRFLDPKEIAWEIYALSCATGTTGSKRIIDGGLSVTS